MLDPSQIRAITLDLDDTLWPIWPAIHRAEEVLLLWLKEHAAKTAALFPTSEALRSIRLQIERERPDLRHDLSALRRESIAEAMRRAGDDERLAIPAFDIFFAQRQQVQLFDDSLPALEFLAQRWPIVAVTNGNADVQRIGIGQFFRYSFNVSRTGFAKPDIRIFHCAAQSLGVPSSAILHIGDDAQLDVVAGRNAGMQVIWVNREHRDWPVPDQASPMMVSSLAQLCDLLR